MGVWVPVRGGRGGRDESGGVGAGCVVQDGGADGEGDGVEVGDGVDDGVDDGVGDQSCC